MMTDEQRHIIFIFLLVMAFFTGATIQLSEGSVIIGIIMFVIALALTTKIKISGTGVTENSKFFIVLGVFILLAEIVYYLKVSDTTGTLKSMAFFMGVSFIAYGTGRYKRMGEFGIYVSGVFTVLYLFFYTLLPSLNDNFIHYFDHYFVLLPSLAIIKVFSNMDIHVVATETVHFKGFEDSSVIIGGPCSGIYSMILLVGLIVGYAKMERLTDKRKLFFLIALTVLIAYIANLIRVSVLYYIGYYYGIEKMMFVHVYLGWIIFIIIFSGIMMVLYKMK